MRSKLLRHEASDGLNRAAVLHQLPEQRAKQEDREEFHHELCGAAHESLRPMGKKRLLGEGGGHERRGRSEDEHAPSAIGEPDEKPERNQDAEEPHQTCSKSTLSFP